ncbi:MAG: RDD family protein [Acidobacteriota bacterium]|nr:RDD family protein [Acidobacteriota bacterium]
MSTLVSQPAPSASWKQEVNRRLAAHKKRKDFSLVEQAPPEEAQSPASSRAAQAAARVAARYAKAPSYSEMQAAEARAALRAAEAATRAALEAQAAAQTALANLESAAGEDAAREEEAVTRKTAKSSARKAKGSEATSATPATAAVQPLEIRWEPDMPMRPAGPPAAFASPEPQRADEARGNWWAPSARPEADEQAIEPVEAAQPIHANLIEFPRELVATRRVRPRLSGAPHGETGDLFGQLSIFEVDPSTISTEPAAPTAAESPAPSWSGPAWSGIELDDLPQEAGTQSEMAATLQLAPLSLRLMATVVDTALIVGVVGAAIALAAGHLQHPPAMKAAELAAVAALLATGVLYNALFLTLAHATPGMMFARISLCTFDDECPSRAQLRGRLGAMLLSLLPVGLGLMWAVFDEDHLCWHDRLSRTYLRKC